MCEVDNHSKSPRMRLRLLAAMLGRWPRMGVDTCWVSSHDNSMWRRDFCAVPAGEDLDPELLHAGTGDLPPRVILDSMSGLTRAG